MKFKALFGIAICVALSCGSAARAGVYADDLGKCLVNSTTKNDRQDLIRWLFVAAMDPPMVRWAILAMAALWGPIIPSSIPPPLTVLTLNIRWRSRTARQLLWKIASPQSTSKIQRSTVVWG